MARFEGAIGVKVPKSKRCPECGKPCFGQKDIVMERQKNLPGRPGRPPHVFYHPACYRAIQKRVARLQAAENEKTAMQQHGEEIRKLTLSTMPTTWNRPRTLSPDIIANLVALSTKREAQFRLLADQVLDVSANLEQQIEDERAIRRILEAYTAPTVTEPSKGGASATG